MCLWRRDNPHVYAFLCPCIMLQITRQTNVKLCTMYCFIPFIVILPLLRSQLILGTEALTWLLTLFNMASGCEQMELHPRILGARCVWDCSISFLTAEEHACALRCLAHKAYKAINNDIENKVCARSETPFPSSLETQAAVPVDECVQWVATHDWN